MRVVSVEYGELKTTAGFNNIKISVTVEVMFGETPEDALLRARKWVQAQIDRQLHPSDQPIPF